MLPPEVVSPLPPELMPALPPRVSPPPRAPPEPAGSELNSLPPQAKISAKELPLIENWRATFANEDFTLATIG